MATLTLGVSTASTTNATSYASGAFTPAAGDLLVAFVRVSGNVVVPQMTDSLGLGWDYVGTSAFDATNANTTHFFVANTPAAASSMTVTFTCVGTTASGAVVNVIRVAGMTKFGSFAIRQIDFSSNNAASTPTVTFGSAPLTTNAILGAIGNATNPATMTPPTSYTELTDTGYATPTIGLETAGIASGITATGITWGSASASAWGAIIVELDTSTTGWTIIQSKQVNKTVGTGTTGTVVMRTTTTGSMLTAVGITDAGAASSITGIAATGTANWTKKVDITDGGGASELGWYGYNTISSATPTLTVTFAASVIATVFINEYVYYNAGVVTAITTDPFDQLKSAIGGASTTPATGNTPALAASGDLLVAGAGTLDSANRYQAGTGYIGASGTQVGTTLDGGVEDAVATSSAAQSASFVITASDFWGTFIMAFKQPGGTSTDNVSVSDSTTTTEALKAEINSFINKSDSTTTTEAVNLTVVSNIGVSDSTTTTESANVEINSQIAVSDSTTTTEAVTLLIPTLFISVSDTTTTTESVKVESNNFIQVSDSTSSLEGVSIVLPVTGITIGVSDSTTTTEAVSLMTQNFIRVADNTTTTESVHTEVNSFVRVSDSTTTSENVTVVITNPIAVSDSTITTESVKLLVEDNIRVSDSTTTTESVTLLIPTLNIAVSDSTTTTESVTVRETNFISVADNTTTSEAVTVAEQVRISVSDTTTTTESVHVSETVSIAVSDSTTTTENVVVFAQGGPLIIRVSDTTTSTETVSLQLKANFAPNYDLPRDTLWEQNANFLQGAVTYDDANTLFDAAIPFDGAIKDNLTYPYPQAGVIWDLDISVNTAWRQNPTYLQGAVTYDDANTLFDAPIPFDGAVAGNITSVYPQAGKEWVVEDLRINKNLWSQNPNFQNGAVLYDDPNTLFDAAIPFDSLSNLETIYAPPDTIWAGKA